jgi:protein-disulfide isomerase
MTDHAVTGEELMAFADGELSRDRADAVARHAASCARCAGDLTDFRELSAQLSQWPVGPTPASIQCPALPGVPSSRRRLARRAAIAVALLALIAMLFYVRRQPPPPDISAASGSKQQTEAPLGADATTPVTVTVFVDWLCPACVGSWPMYVDTLRRYQAQTTRVSFVVRDWPWNSTCNPASSTTIPGHDASCDAAVAVRLARKAGQAESMIAWLFEHQGELMEPEASQGRIRARVRDTLGIADVDAAFREELPKILDDIADGAARSVQITPCWFVDAMAIGTQGKLPTPTQLDEAIRRALRGGR